jgi:hypothetical protein
MGYTFVHSKGRVSLEVQLLEPCEGGERRRQHSTAFTAHVSATAKSKTKVGENKVGRRGLKETTYLKYALRAR